MSRLQVKRKGRRKPGPRRKGGRKTHCRHCRKGKRSRPRGLCWTCFRDGSIRGLYPRGKFDPGVIEPTEEELDVLIARQMQRFPRWWERENRRQMTRDFQDDV